MFLRRDLRQWADYFAHTSLDKAVAVAGLKSACWVSMLSTTNNLRLNTGKLPMKRHFLGWLLGTAAVLVSGLAAAQPYPAKPLRLVVPFQIGRAHV